MKTVHLTSILFLAMFSLVSCSIENNYNNSSTFFIENDSSKSEYADSIIQSNIEEVDTTGNNHEFYCLLPQSFVIGEITYVSNGLISDPSISLDNLIGYLVNNEFDGEKNENLVYVSTQFQTYANDVSLPLYLLVGKTLEEAVAVHTSLYDFAYIPDNDYHWYRQNYDGTWSHKPGRTNVTNRDNSNNVIYDPEICNRNSGSLNYTEFYGFFQVNTSSMI